MLCLFVTEPYKPIQDSPHTLIHNELVDQSFFNSSFRLIQTGFSMFSVLLWHPVCERTWYVLRSCYRKSTQICKLHYSQRVGVGRLYSNREAFSGLGKSPQLSRCDIVTLLACMLFQANFWVFNKVFMTQRQQLCQKYKHSKKLSLIKFLSSTHEISDTVFTGSKTTN